MTGRVGTLAYMAHEVALCKPYNEKVDIYGFGMILWQLVSGTYIHTLSREKYHTLTLVSIRCSREYI